MKLLSFKEKESSLTKIGVALPEENQIIELSAIEDFPESMLLLIRDFEKYSPIIESAFSNEVLPKYKFEDIVFEPPVDNPGKMICTGLNFHDHIAETKEVLNLKTPHRPFAFSGFSSSLTGHGKKVAIPEWTSKFDYELEIAVYIKKECYKVSVEEAEEYIFGFSIFNDLTARDLQKEEIASGLLLGAKNGLGFGPIGPFIVPKDHIPDWRNLDMKLTVNGKTRQQSNSSQMIFSFAELISYWSNLMPLKPGDIITSGTPAGVAMGMKQPEEYYLRNEDVIVAEIENLGTLQNRMVVQ